MSKTTVNDVTIEIIRGDIADQPDMDAIVNAANAQLETGGGVAGASIEPPGRVWPRQPVNMRRSSPARR